MFGTTQHQHRIPTHWAHPHHPQGTQPQAPFPKGLLSQILSKHTNKQLMLLTTCATSCFPFINFLKINFITVGLCDLLISTLVLLPDSTLASFQAFWCWSCFGEKRHPSFLEKVLCSLVTSKLWLISQPCDLQPFNFNTYYNTFFLISKKDLGSWNYTGFENTSKSRQAVKCTKILLFLHQQNKQTTWKIIPSQEAEPRGALPQLCCSFWISAAKPEQGTNPIGLPPACPEPRKAAATTSLLQTVW